MPHISADELKRPVFDGVAHAITGSPILQVLLLFAVSIGAAFLKSYMESIREIKPNQFAIIMALLILLIVFGIGMWISEL